MTAKKFTIIHGTKSSPTSNWFPWLAGELTKKGVSVVIPEMPTPIGQSLESWQVEFKKQVGTLDESTIVIGHSLGAVFLLRLLEQQATPIGGSIFVAGLTGVIGIDEYDKLNASFIDSPYNWDLIRKNSGSCVCISGDADPYVPRAQSEALARNLLVEDVIVPHGGHLNTESGFTTFPRLLEELLIFIDF